MLCVSFQILHATELEFLEDLNNAKDLDQIIAIHNNFVATIYERCLLHHKVSLLKEAIMKVLNMTLTFQQWWDQGVASMKYVLVPFQLAVCNLAKKEVNVFQMKTGFPLELGNMAKWEGIFQSSNIEQTRKVRKISQNTGKVWEFQTMLFINFSDI